MEDVLKLLKNYSKNFGKSREESESVDIMTSQGAMTGGSQELSTLSLDSLPAMYRRGMYGHTIN